jgi:cytochrome b involved in lipid metabolism
MNIKKAAIIGIMILVLILTGVFAAIFLKQSETPSGPATLTIDSASEQRPTYNDSQLEYSDRALTLEEVALHNSPQDCWVVINSSVYDVTAFALGHPGSPEAIYQFCGQDATQAFNTKGGNGTHSGLARRELSSLKIGELDE